MAVAEARAVWQRTVNRCFVQEDGKRAPKLACCQSSSSTLKLLDTGLTSTADGLDHPPVAVMPLNQNPCTNLSPDPRWWLQQQPCYRYQSGLTSEQLTDIDPDKFTTSKHMDELSFRSESSCTVCEKTEPWWRVTSRNELASFVAQKSLGCIENCDLPPPRKLVKSDPSARIGGAECGGDNSPSSLDRKGLTYDGSSCPNMYIPAATSTQKRGSSSAICKDTTDGQIVLESDSTKAQLTEALCHSQTRAREAEKAAKQACAETERVVKLFFREASQLFAYKQWIQLLQLDANYGQKKSNDEQTCDDHPTVPCHIPIEGSKLENGQKAIKENRQSQDITDFAVAFAFGLSLVGAGLILGWTVGWMLRSF